MWRAVFKRITDTIWHPDQSIDQSINQSLPSPNTGHINSNNKRDRNDDAAEQAHKRVKLSNEAHDCIKCSYLTVELTDLRDEMSSVQSLHQSSLCAICQHLLIEPVTLDCSHSFCSVCCVKALRRSKQCPLCRHAVERTPQKASIQLKSLIAILVTMMTPEEQAERIVEEASRVRSQTIDGVKSDQQLERLFEIRRRGLQRRAPIFDESDNVWRCPYCAFELVEGADCCSPLDWSVLADDADTEPVAANGEMDQAEIEEIDVDEQFDESEDYESDLDDRTRHALHEAERRLSDRSGLSLALAQAIRSDNRRNRPRRRVSLDDDELDGGVREVFRVMFDADERDGDASDENVELPLYIDDEAQEVGISRPSQQSYADFHDVEAQFSDMDDFSDNQADQDDGDEEDDFDAEFEAQFQRRDESDDDEAEYQ